MKITSTAIWSTVLALLAIASPANSGAQITQQGTKSLFRIKFTKGETHKYKVKLYMGVEGSAQQEPTVMEYSMFTKAVSGTNAIVDVTTKGQDKPETISMDSRGKTSSKSATSLFSNDFAVLPEKAVAIGDSWSNSGQAAGLSGPMTVKSTSTFKGFKTVDNKKMAHIALKLDLSGSGMTGTGTGDLLHDVKNGMTYRSNTKIDMVASDPQSNKKMKLKVSVQIQQL